MNHRKKIKLKKENKNTKKLNSITITLKNKIDKKMENLTDNVSINLYIFPINYNSKNKNTISHASARFSICTYKKTK